MVWQRYLGVKSQHTTFFHWPEFIGKQATYFIQFNGNKAGLHLSVFTTHNESALHGKAERKSKLALTAKTSLLMNPEDWPNFLNLNDSAGLCMSFHPELTVPSSC